jgi:hypothetical protein
VLHPQTFCTHAVPAALPAQLATHVPAFAAEQQPPLHAWELLHAVVHVWVVVSHAEPTGHCPEDVQPHVSPALASGSSMHAPASSATQLEQAPPMGPQVVALSLAHDVPLQHVP